MTPAIQAAADAADWPGVSDHDRWICPMCGEGPKLDSRWRWCDGRPQHHHCYPVGHVLAEEAVTVFVLPLELGDGQSVTVVTDPQAVADAVKVWCEEGMWGESLPPIRCERWPASELEKLEEV